MSDANTVVIISDRQELINQISQKLVLLRNLDKIKTCSIEEATSALDSFNPNVLILHCDTNNQNALSLIKKVKQIPNYENLPILFINENCSRETIIEAFDLGISDILFVPIIDYELLIRVIWCMQKNEINLSISSNTNFLNKLGITQNESGVYSKKYCDEFLQNEIEQSKKYSQKACILLIAPDKKYPNYKNQKDFIQILKKSTRLNDSIIIKNEDEYYVYLHKTKLNGAYSVFERINNNLGAEFGSNAGVVEVQDQTFEDIKEALDAALEKANENTNSLIVASDFYTQKQKYTPLNENTNEIILNGDDNITTEELKKTRPNPASNAFDKNSIKLFNQAFARKLKVVIIPTFRRYENVLKAKSQNFIVNTCTGTKSIFNVSQGNLNASMIIEYDEIEHVIIRLNLSDGEQRKMNEVETVDFTVLDYRKISLMLKEVIDNFIILAKRKAKGL